MVAIVDKEDMSNLRSIGIGKKVLVIDDNKYARSILKKILREFGYEVQIVEDGTTGLTKMFEFHPDVVLLDLMMPKLDGIEVLRMKIKIAELDKIQVIMVSAYSEAKQVQLAIALGAVDYILKPVTPNQMINRIMRVLQSKTPLETNKEGLIKPVDGRTHLLLLSPNEDFHQEFRSGLPDIYKINIVPSIDELQEYYASSFSEFVLAEQASLDIVNAAKLKSTINSIDKNKIIQPYLYFEKNMDQSEIDKYLQQGLFNCIRKPENPDDLLNLMNETFEVNLIEVITAENNVKILKRKRLKTIAAGKEVTRIVEELTHSGVKKFIIDLSVLETIELEEIWHMSKFSNHQTKMGIKVNFVITSEKVHKSFIEFIETENVSISDSVESAMKKLN